VHRILELEHPIVQAPLGGGPSTPELASAVSGAGGLGFLAAGYLRAEAVRADIESVRRLTERPFGVNLFAPPGPPADPQAVESYAASLRAEAARHGAEVGDPRHDDDGFEEKLRLLAEERVAVVSLTFGCPSREVVAAMSAAGTEVWVTVTKVSEALTAAATGADVLVVQGVEAAGHRGSFDDEEPGDLGLLALLQLVREAVDLPLVAAGGLATGRSVAAVLAAGASAAQLGTAFMLTPEAGTSAPHRRALRSDMPTALTRAFTGRTARGIVNRFLVEHPDAPSAYPDVHHLTAPLRAAAREAHALAQELPAAELTRRLGEEARNALREAAH
jgi:nitronate monooxygenase